MKLRPASLDMGPEYRRLPSDHPTGLHPEEMTLVGFAGGGGSDEGITESFRKVAVQHPDTIRRFVDVAINHDPEAVAMNRANHPETEFHCQNIWTARPMDVARGRPIGLAWFSPDCFPAGTLVLTREGYQPIEQIEVGDEVLTHLGRWRKVVETHRAIRPLIELRGHGHPGLKVSPEHPFYARTRSRKWNNERRAYDHSLDDVTWAKAEELDRGWYWSTPWKFPDSCVPPVGGRGMEITPQLMWLAGRYLGDGWTRLTDSRAELVIVCGRHEGDELDAALKRWPRTGDRSGHNELAWHRRDVQTGLQFSTNHEGLVRWLRQHFGHGAENKAVPTWALGMPAELRQSLLSGYLSADGYHTKDFDECMTVSKALAFSMKALAASLGKTVSVYFYSTNTTEIEGRTVNAKPYWKLRWRHAVADDHAQTERIGHLEWTPIREQIDQGERGEVFNIGVEDDESYVVEGITVHNCKHFSKAKGGKPVEKNIRDLAWVVVAYAKDLPRHQRPRVILLENVEEFRDWAPLVEVIGEDGKPILDVHGSPLLKPCPKRKGETFMQWVGALRRLGYRVEWRELVASDYGAPTSRKRLYVIARCDGEPIVWPQATHGDPAKLEPGMLPWRTAAECIDWSIPCPSIFLTREEARKVGANRPLVPATLRRVAKGVRRYVLEHPRPFIVSVAHGDSGGRREFPIEQPLGTQHAGGNKHAVVTPCMAPITHTGDDRVHSVEEPVRTLTAGPKRGEQAVISPYLVPRYGERPATATTPGQEPRTVPVTGPMPTQVPTANQGSLAAVHMAKFRGDSIGTPMDGQAPVVTANSFKKRPGGAPPLGVVATFLAQHNTGMVGHHPEKPLSTMVQKGCTQGVVAASLVKQFGTSTGAPVDSPAPTVLPDGAGGKTGLSAVSLVKYYDTAIGQTADEPLHAATTKPRFAAVDCPLEEAPGLTEEQRYSAWWVARFIEEHAPARPVPGVLATIPAPRPAMLTVGEWAIVDIGLRMLQPRELFNAQGFRGSYIIDRGLFVNAKTGEQEWRPLTKTASIRMVGNSVCPDVAEALVTANLVKPAEQRRRLAA